MENKNSLYLVLTIILIILSAVGGYFLFNIYQERNFSNYTSSTIPKIELIPTDTIEKTTDEDTSISFEVITPTVTKTTPIASATATPKLTVTPNPSVIPTTSKDVVLYENKEDGFFIEYSSTRKIYQDIEPKLYYENRDLVTDPKIKGNRYTFSDAEGKQKFAVHVSPKPAWSWWAPRQFTSSLLVSGKNTFRYDNKEKTITIIDLQSDSKNYTLQCIHNGLESLKTECDQFVSSFQLL